MELPIPLLRAGYHLPLLASGRRARLCSSTSLHQAKPPSINELGGQSCAAGTAECAGDRAKYGDVLVRTVEAKCVHVLKTNPMAENLPQCPAFAPELAKLLGYQPCPPLQLEKPQASTSSPSSSYHPRTVHVSPKSSPSDAMIHELDLGMPARFIYSAPLLLTTHLWSLPLASWRKRLKKWKCICRGSRNADAFLPNRVQPPASAPGWLSWNATHLPCDALFVE